MSLSIDDLLSTLTSDGLLDDKSQAAVITHLQDKKNMPGDPVYIRILAAGGAWAAAICFISFLVISDLLSDSDVSQFGWGFGFLLGSILLRRGLNSIFWTQLALAFTSAGHMILIWWCGITYESIGAVALTRAAITLVMYGIYPDPIYRFLASTTTLALTTFWMFEAKYHHNLLHVLIGLEAVVMGLVLAGRKGVALFSPLAYACATALLGSILLYTGVEDFQGPLWPMRIIITIGLIGLYIWAAGGQSRLSDEWMLAAIGATILLGIFSNPGILAAVGLLVLGHALGDRICLVFGAVFLPVFIVIYYYSLNVDLAYKSWVLGGSGLVLLALRWFLSRRPWAEEDAP